MNEDEITKCMDGCGREVGVDGAQQAGWTELQTLRRWRCPWCQKELDEVNTIISRENLGPI